MDEKRIVILKRKGKLKNEKHLSRLIQFSRDQSVEVRNLVIKGLVYIVENLPDSCFNYTDEEICFYLVKLNEGIVYDTDYVKNIEKKMKAYAMTKFMNRVEVVKEEMKDKGVPFKWHLVVSDVYNPKEKKGGGISKMRSDLNSARAQNIQYEEEIMRLQLQINELNDKLTLKEVIDNA